MMQRVQAFGCLQREKDEAGWYPHNWLSPSSCLWVTAAFLVAGLINLVSADPWRGREAEQRLPNVVLILADDLGWRDLAVQGSSFYETPNIDRIAKEGVLFTQAYATSPVCSPSRASILTGKFAASHGITQWIGSEGPAQWRRNTRLLPADYLRALPHRDLTLAEAMREAGYRTFFVGKWHLGAKTSYPEDHGFEFNVGGWEAGSPIGGYFSPYKNPKLRDGPPGEYLPIRLAQEAVRFIRSSAGQPFFLFLSFYSVHAPLQTTKELWSKYRAKASKMPPVERRFVMGSSLPVRIVQDHPIYAGMIEAMDRAIGLVLQTLDELEIAKDTVVIFTSDNGGVCSGDAYATSNLPLRGGKGQAGEGGLRVPLLIKWPGVVQGGRVCDVPVSGADLYPTVLEMCNLSLRPEQHRDGISIAPLLRGGSIPQRVLYWHYPHYSNQGGAPFSAVREGDWKLVFYYEDEHAELYNIREDPGEQHNLASSEAERVGRMLTKLRRYLQQTGASLPLLNPNFDEDQQARHLEWVRTTLLGRLEREHAEVHNENWSPDGGWWESRFD